MLPYHKDKLISDNTDWCKPYGVDCEAVKEKLNKFYNIFYAPDINHGGNIRTIYEWRDDYLIDQRILVKDVSEILSGHTKFVLKYRKDKNSPIRNIADYNFDVKYGL
jgi:hypothetical protein